MSDNSKRFLFGGLLVLVGVIFILQQLFNWSIGGVFISMLFAAGAFVFLFVYLRDHTKWWALIPGFTLLGLAVVIATGDLSPRFSGRFGGALFLGCIALAFILIFVTRRDFWWAVIPAGVLTTIAIITAIPAGNGLFTGGFFFLGIGATFGVLGLLPVGKKDKWPWIPAAILLVFGSMLTVGALARTHTPFGLVFAGVFLLAGIYLVVRTLLKKD
jgi:hypothetical protein